MNFSSFHSFYDFFFILSLQICFFFTLHNFANMMKKKTILQENVLQKSFRYKLVIRGYLRMIKFTKGADVYQKA